MAVLKNASLLDSVVIDASSPANINYVKARMAIEAAGMARAERRLAKMTVISYLKGEIRHPERGPNQVVFPDKTAARF